MLNLIAFVMALAAQAPTPAPGPFLMSDEIAQTLKNSIANKVVDQPMKMMKVDSYNVTVAMLHREAAETSALIHDRVTEIYQITQGSGTLVVGGAIADAKETDLTRLGAGPSHTGKHTGGESRHVAPGDVIIVPGGTPHRFSQLDAPVSYLVYRFDPKP